MPEGTPPENILFSSPVDGTAVPLEQCPDKIFSQGAIGQGLLLLPTGNTLYAPADAKVDFFFFTGHAMGLETAEGLQFLLHVGLDTHKLEGRGFQIFARTGDLVKRGDKLLSFDADLIRRSGYPLCTPFVFCNLNHRTLKVLKTGAVRAGEDLMAVQAHFSKSGDHM